MSRLMSQTNRNGVDFRGKKVASLGQKKSMSKMPRKRKFSGFQIYDNPITIGFMPDADFILSIFQIKLWRCSVEWLQR